ncbi:hypothetical protein, partial [Klebsiella pneumoniae]|uniref:hypothetical protein n=1 Tax=Klebsiella pneumoniae TaxID=573 RepID=UPI00132F5C22
GKLLKGGSKLIGKSGGSAAAGPLPGADIAGHFASLRAVIQETDGVPPLIGDAELALGAFANELQTVAASPD